MTRNKKVLSYFRLSLCRNILNSIVCSPFFLQKAEIILKSLKPYPVSFSFVSHLGHVLGDFRFKVYQSFSQIPVRILKVGIFLFARGNVVLVFVLILFFFISVESSGAARDKTFNKENEVKGENLPFVL